MAEVVLVNPAFETSYWGLEHALPLFGKRANVPPASLPLLAALTPPEHGVTLVDESVEALDFERLARADIVGITGMSVQRSRMREVAQEVKRRGGFLVVGGPWVTVQEDYFAGLADVIFVGEAEETWPRFLRDWQQGVPQRRYEQTSQSDMTKVPVPRWDRLMMRHYMFGSTQFSRGCPFQCEFCDIIVTFGRRPRLKTSAQVISELEALLAQKMEIIFVVDDNLIGNKTAIKAVLRDLAEWQRRNAYPLMFFTEASLDLSEDEELMRLMVEANFVSVFVGIESPNEASLVEPSGSFPASGRETECGGRHHKCRTFAHGCSNSSGGRIARSPRASSAPRYRSRRPRTCFRSARCGRARSTRRPPTHRPSPQNRRNLPRRSCHGISCLASKACEDLTRPDTRGTVFSRPVSPAARETQPPAP